MERALDRALLADFLRARREALSPEDMIHHHDLKRYRHPELGELELYARRLVDPDEGQELLVFLAEPGSASEEKLQRLTTMS